MATDTITKAPRVTRQAEEWQPPAAGTWWWVTGMDRDDPDAQERWLGCATEVGTNYVEFTAANGGSCRVHFDQLHEVEPADDASDYIARRIAQWQGESRRLLGEVKELTARLAIPVDGDRSLPDAGGVTQALAVRSGDAVPRYKAELVKAQKETLPELFKGIRDANEKAAMWMKAELLPIRSELDRMKGAEGAIVARIFNVELYAGLSEQMTCVREGAPAGIAEPVRLFQRRHYMDEECLARYEAGGMDFRDIAAFDRWLLKPENLSRLLPFQRCIVAFRVRRDKKDYEDEVGGDIGAFIKIVLGGWEDMNKTTYLYIRNGEQVHRLTTTIPFDDPLFPDADNRPLDSSVLYVKDVRHGAKYMVIITEGEYEGRCAEYDAAEAAWLALSDAERKKKWWRDHGSDPRGQFILYTPDSVYYDDITKELHRRIEEHNRLVLVLQGLFDRSPALHPHPPYKLWTADDFARAVVPVFDESRGLAPATPPPDFEEYRRRLNATMKVGDYATGQDDAWQEDEAVKYNARQHADWRVKDHRDVRRHKPYGNPGPGVVAQVQRLGKAGALFKWWRERTSFRNYGADRNIGDRVTVPVDRLLNVSAYTPGDYRLFFDDPRTRRDYLRWAPMLLAAEDWHAEKANESGQK